MPRSIAKVALLLFGSGACSLIYETVWLRELRLVFGASTMASAAVVACFVGGLGAGGLLFGKRADAHPRPLAMYGLLEAGIAASAAITPLLLVLVRGAYIAIGGSTTLGAVFGTVVRLLLAALVFAVPTLLMGGTLPAVARAVESGEDRGRRTVALLYGVNTLGAVTGCMASTFAMFEVFGTRATLWIACLVNALVAMTARSLARTMPAPAPREPAVSGESPKRDRAAPAWLTLTAAGVAGFVFCLMELVWYRMLGPLLGGTVFTFGLILALALLGIGLGGVAYSLRGRASEATMIGFAWTCLLEAAFVAVPYALGDRLAILAAMVRPMSGLSFALQIGAWSAIAGIVVVPAAFVSGVQFPLLIGLLGRGDEDVGRDVGLAYATNTLGAIAGSLAGGFGLIPALTAPGCWRFVVWLLVALGAVAVGWGARERPLRAIGPALAGVVAIVCVRAMGPTAAWRHSPIGAGRVDANAIRTPNGAREWENSRRRAILWEADGRESSVGLDYGQGLAFIVNGKNDGNARIDAGTAVMSGVIGALLHPNPTSAMVIGLGTGETSGWLAAIDTIETVDVAELEPAVLEAARQSAVANHDALANPKMHVTIGDARELLLVSKRKYDLIASEPSNPYRAGIASLFTREYYEAIVSRLAEGGLFLQWMQGYEIDAQTIKTVYATLSSVFPHVETWELGGNDMLLISSLTPVPHDIARIRARMALEPYKSACAYTWRATDPELVFAHFVAADGLARAIAAREGTLVNTDDRNTIEFGFARTVGTGVASFNVFDVRETARARGEERPAITGGALDWERVDDGVTEYYLAESMSGVAGPMTEARAHRIAALRAFDAGDAPRVLHEWASQLRPPTGPTEIAVVGASMADVGDERAVDSAKALAPFDEAEGDAIVARLRLRQVRLDDATSSLESFFTRMRRDPWPMTRLLVTALRDAQSIAQTDPRLAPRLYAALREPLALRCLDDMRQRAAAEIAARVPGGAACLEAMGAMEPDPPWNEDFLRRRLACYRGAHDARAGRAEDDLVSWMVESPSAFASGLEPGK
jgi:predicted membrane-bound spermidine synthase